MDESASLALHRWRSLCRLLMWSHPRVGAEMYSHLYRGPAGLRRGWNALHQGRSPDAPVTYMFLSEDGGKHSVNKPACADSEINHVYESDLPDLVDTLAWRKMEEFAEILRQQSNEGVTAEYVTRVMRVIRERSHGPLRADDGTIEQIFLGARDAAQSAIQRGAAFFEVILPSIDVVRSYLAFQLTGHQAGNALALILLFYSTVPSPLDRTPQAERVLGSARHLAERCTSLLRSRARMSLTSFHDMTYLAALYGQAAALLFMNALAHGKMSAKQKKLVNGTMLFVEETVAHDAVPTFGYPALVFPAGVIETMREGLPSNANMEAVYPAVREALARGARPDDMRRAVRDASARAEHVEVRETLEGDNRPVDEPTMERVATFVITMALGRDFRVAPEDVELLRHRGRRHGSGGPANADGPD
jgi:hypothetical protein